MANSSSHYNLRMLAKPFALDLRSCALLYGLAPTQKCEYPGHYAEAFDVIVPQIKQFINFTLIDGETYDWSSIIEDLKSGFIDTSMVCRSRTHKFEQIFKFNHIPMYEIEGHALAVASRPVDSLVPTEGLKKFLTVFQPCLWLTVVLLWVTVYIYRHYRPKVVNAFELHKKLLMLLVALLSMFSLDLYANGLITRLVLPIDRSLFHDTASLAAAVRSGHVKVALYQNGTFAELVRQAQERKIEDLPPLKQLAIALGKRGTVEIRPFLEASFPAEKLQSLIEENFVFIGMHEEMALLAKRLCNWRILKVMELNDQFCWWMFSAHTPDWVIDKIDNAFRKQWNVIETTAERYHRLAKRDVRPTSCPEKPKPQYVFTMTEMFGACLILSIGLGLAIVGFVGERITKVTTANRNTKLPKRMSIARTETATSLSQQMSVFPS